MSTPPMLVSNPKLGGVRLCASSALRYQYILVFVLRGDRGHARTGLCSTPIATQLTVGFGTDLKVRSSQFLNMPGSL